MIWESVSYGCALVSTRQNLLIISLQVRHCDILHSAAIIYFITLFSNDSVSWRKSEDLIIADHCDLLKDCIIIISWIQLYI